jgi:hypothetical protein
MHSKNKTKKSKKPTTLKGFIAITLAILAASALAVLTSGCSGARDALFQPAIYERPALTVNHVDYVSNLVATVSTNAATGEIARQTNLVAIQITNTITLPPMTITNWGVKQEVQDASALASLAIPGYGQIAVGAFGLVTSVWLGWLNRRHRSFGVATVQGVEDFRLWLRTNGLASADTKLTEILQRSQWDSGTKELAERIIDHYTGYTQTVSTPPATTTQSA